MTGSTAGIGLAIATALAKEGAGVVVNGRTAERVSAAVATIQAAAPGAKVDGIAGDLGQADGVARFLEALPEVDILVNNLGIFEPRPFAEIRDEDWFRFFEVNVMSGVRLSRHYLPRMLARNWGRVVFISSESAVNIPSEMIHYGFTKTAQLAVSRGLAEMTAGTGVTVNAVLPGPTMSEGVTNYVKDLASAQKATPAQVEREFFKTMRPTSLLQRFASPEEVAAMVAFVCSPVSSATNGAALRVEGGLLRSIV